MDLLRLPWNGGQGRPQFQIDNLFRRDGQQGNQVAERGGGGGGAMIHNGGTDHFDKIPKDYKITSPLQKVLDGMFDFCCCRNI